ncbi:MAG: GNAT family N-acetyltransferase [Anaerolineae bacterium]|jgi:mycothiol synthase
MPELNVALRPFTWDDLPTVVDLINRGEAVDQVERGTSEEETRTWWGSPPGDPEQDAFLAVLDGQAVGYGRVLLREGEGFSRFEAYGTVAPQWRRWGVGTQIFAECERRAVARLQEATTPTVYLQAHADRCQQDVAELYARFGLMPVRYFFQMMYDAGEMPVRPHYPPGYSGRNFVRNQDEETMWRVTNAAFQDHWGHTDDLLDEWLHWFEGDYFDPALAYLGLDPVGQPAGTCMCTIYPERNERLGREQGVVDVLGVLREHRRKGLGRALLLEGMRALRRRGCTHLVLGVDSENPTGALGLYESAGFREWRTRVAFRKVLRE